MIFLLLKTHKEDKLQGFQTLTGPYWPFLRSVKHEEPFHAKKTVNRTNCNRTTRFYEPLPVQAVHTGPLFQALNSTILDSLPCFFFSYTVSFGLWNWIILSNKKPSPHSFNQETLGKYRPKFKIRPAWSLDCKTKISTKKKIEEERNEINKRALQKK